MVWYSKLGGIGQFRVTDIDKENGILKYKSSDNKDYQTKIDNDFYLNANDAFDAAQRYNNLHLKSIDMSGGVGRPIYKSPEEVTNTQIQTMLLD